MNRSELIQEIARQNARITRLLGTLPNEPLNTGKKGQRKGVYIPPKPDSPYIRPDSLYGEDINAFIDIHEKARRQEVELPKPPTVYGKRPDIAEHHRRFA